MRHFVSITKEGIVTKSDHEDFSEGVLFSQNLKENLVSIFYRSFSACVSKGLTTGFETSRNLLSGSVLYTFTLKKDSIILLTIDQLSFESSPSYKDTYFRAILDNSNDFIYKCDVYGHFTYVNKPVKDRLGFSYNSDDKVHFSSRIREDYRETVAKFYENQVKSRIKNTYLEFPALTLDGEVVWLGQNVQLLGTDDWVFGIQAFARDITENKMIENELLEIQNKNQALIDSFPDSIYMFDSNFILINKKVDENSYFFDINIGQSIDTSSLDIHKLNVIKESILKTVNTYSIHKIEINTDITGKEQFFEIRISPINQLQILVLVRNITEQRRQNRLMLNAQEKERNALEAKQRYLSVMTHEIRTPLSAVIGFTELLMETNPTPNQLEYLKNIKSSSAILEKVINDVLDYNKIEKEKIEIESVSFNFKKLINEVVQNCKIQVNNKLVKLNIDIQEEIPNVLEGDPLRITQILTNLISNALKFTNEGEVTVNVKLIEIFNESVHLYFSIKDTGIGIPENKLESIFESYVQGDTTISRKYGGTGLGLTITKKFIELLGGNLKVESTINTGSTFSFDLVLQISEKLVSDNRNTVKNVDLSNYTVLLVEDNEMNQLVMSKYFQKWGLNYDIAENGKAALKLIEDREYNIVLMDLEMPVMDGYEAANIIRNHSNKAIRGTKLIALSASVLSEAQKRTENIGFDEFIGKPINGKYIYSRIVEHLMKESSSTTSTAPIETSTYQTSNGIDLSYLFESALNDVEYIKKMVNLFLDSSPRYLDNMEKLFIEQDYDELRKLAHKFKASISIMGIKSAEKKIIELEDNIIHKINYGDLRNLIDDIKIDVSHACDELNERVNQQNLFS